MNEQNKKYVNYKSKKTNRRDPHLLLVLLLYKNESSQTNQLCI